MIELRQYQIDLINTIKKNLKHKSICIVSPCGSGKSIIQGMIAKGATDKGNRVLFLVHRKELVEQIEETFKLCGVNFDLCEIGMVQTITRRLDKQKSPVIIITDENHHCLAKSYIKIYEKFPVAIKLGFTATPIRLGGKGLHPVYNKLVEGPTVNWLIDNKYLSPYKLYSKKLVDTSKLHIRQGDYKQDEVNALMEKNKIYGDTIKNYKELANGKKTIVYCSSIKSSKETAKEFSFAGYSSKHLDGKTSKKERQQAIQDFRDNKITVLCNVDLFGEGFDVPDCECVILLRPTKSLSLYIQQSMRSMRYKENKEAIIIDHVGNCFEHGLPNQEFDWSLEDQQKKNKKNKSDEDIKIKQCKQCFAIVDPSVKVCPYCGYEFPVKEIKVKETEDIILKEIKELDILKKKPYNYYYHIKTAKKLINFAKAKGYKPLWLLKKIEERLDILTINWDDLVEIQKHYGYKFMWIIHAAIKYNVEIPEKYNTLRRYVV